MKGHMVRGPLHKQLDLERKHAKQAEARLSQHLQRLERTYLCHLRLLAWEQRQLQKQLQRLQQGNPGTRVGTGAGHNSSGPGLRSSWKAHTLTSAEARPPVFLFASA